jgi:hypothetical protein
VSKRTKFLLGIGVIATLVIGWQVAAFAVHDAGVFELEGNALDDPAPGDDWENVFNGTQTGSGAGAKAFLTETPADASTIFTGGGSKDPIDIPSWKWKDGGGLPDKDNLLHAFAARYTPTTGAYAGDELLYFGSDRFDNSGDAVQGFWFFQGEVTTDGTPSGTFTGTHQKGDLLILSDFSNGGTTSTIAVYEWDSRCTKTGQTVDRDGDTSTTDDILTCGDANLLTLASDDSAKCGTEANDDFCGIVNPNTIELPWPFVDKSGTTLPDDPNDPDTDPEPAALNGEFYEGGVNLTALDLGDRCFTTVGAETRSSTSTTAVLKDFIIGEFGSCESGIVTNPVLASDGTTPVPAGGVSPGTAVKDSATITVSGTTTWTGTLKFFLCGPDDLDANNLCSTGGTPVGADQTVTQATTQPILSDAVSPTTPGRYCFRGEFDSQTTGVADDSDFSGSECFTVKQPTTVTTEQRWTPNDTATVTPAGTDGSVEFKLYNSSDCGVAGNDAPVYTETDTDADNNDVFVTNNTTFRTDSTTVSWKATFTPTNTNIDPSTGVCETMQVTIDNDGP